MPSFWYWQPHAISGAVRVVINPAQME